jgi:hypothetical protein
MKVTILREKSPVFRFFSSPPVKMFTEKVSLSKYPPKRLALAQSPKQLIGGEVRWI